MKITSEEQLRALYDKPKERALKKEMDKLDKHAICYISISPFLVISTISKDGKVDASPRGGSPGFVKVLGEKQIIIPDSKGNNRLDSLVNIVESGLIGTIFLIPGIDETLRINGTAEISTDQQYLDQFSDEKNPPKSCIIITVKEVFLHCAKALMRSKLWSDKSKVERDTLPSMGQMLKDQIGLKGDPESQEDMIKRYEPDL